jgi:hypothetical protein
MTFAPATILDLAAFWVGQGGVNSGIVGNLAHQQRASYHNGQDVIAKYGRTAATDYTIRLPRDREPYLTNAAAALDLGRLDGTLANLQKFSRWLVAQIKANPAAYRDIRDVIYSPDGKVVKRWDNETKTLYAGGDGTGQGDNSHLWHTHISFYRDSESRDKRPMFRPYFAPTVPVPGDPTMPVLSTYLPGQEVTVKAGKNVRSGPTLTATVVRTTTVVEKWTGEGAIVGMCKGDLDTDCNGDDWIVRANPATHAWEYTSKCNLSAGPAPTPDSSPFTQADLDAAKSAGQLEGKASNEAIWEAWAATHP